MKSIGYLFLCLYLFTLSLLPCGDKRDCMERNMPVSGAMADHHDHEDDTESCSPLCICACCSIQVTINAEQVMIQAPAIKSPEFVPHTLCALQERISAIWQPPKIA